MNELVEKLATPEASIYAAEDSGARVRAMPVAVVVVSALLLVTVPAFFERLHSDEVIYWEVARNIIKGLGMTSETLPGGGFMWHAPWPYFIVAPFLFISEHIFTARVVSSMATVGSAVLVYLVAAQKHRRAEAVASALLFTLSFQVLRFGGRFYLDQYGVFFFLLALLFVYRTRYIAAGVAAVVMVASREYWLGMLVPMAIFVFFESGQRATRAFIAPVAASGAALIIYMAFTLNAGGAGLIEGINGAVAGNLHAVLTQYPTAELARRVVKGWAEYALLNVLVVAGFAVWVLTQRTYRYLLLAAPHLVLVGLVHGFVVDGGVTQYPMALTAAMAPFAAPGLVALAGRATRSRLSYAGTLAVILMAALLQFGALNVMATTVSLHGNFGTYGLGYGPDREVIEKLRAEASGAYIFGIHGAFVDDRLRWAWNDYMVQDGIDTDPDFLVTYSNYVEVVPGALHAEGAELTYIGPYVVVRARGEVPMAEIVRQKGFERWQGAER